jgi:hypothetical protein
MKITEQKHFFSLSLLTVFVFMATLFFLCPLKTVPRSMSAVAHSGLCDTTGSGMNTRAPFALPSCISFHFGTFEHVEKSTLAGVFAFVVPMLYLLWSGLQLRWRDIHLPQRFRHYLASQYQFFLAFLDYLITRKIYHWFSHQMTQPVFQIV